MSSFDELIAEKPIITIHLQRKAVLLKVDNHIEKLKELNIENPNSRIFARIEKDANETLHSLAKANSAFVSALVKANSYIETDESYKKDQKHVREVKFKCINAIEAYLKILEDKGLTRPQDSKPGLQEVDVAQILKESNKFSNQLTNQILTKQDENIEKLLKLSNSGAPKPTQPHFKSSQTDADYQNFKEFFSRFEHFTKKVTSPADKLEWLQS